MRLKIAIIPVLLFIIFSACKKDKFLTSGKLEFSTDTLMFDTVFTTIGSTTANFKVYNPYNQDIQLKSIHLGGVPEAHYRLNIDGTPTSKIENVVIPAKDSLFIFVEVTVNPTSQNSPMVVLDSVVFETETSTQDVKLVAWGQDVHLLNAKTIAADTTWTNDKPYLIYNSMLVDSLVTLTINKGTQIYIHHGSLLYIKGSLVVNGSYDNPVVFQGDRLEEFYDDVPGQWDRIVFLEGSHNNSFNYAIVKNGIIGIQVGTLNLTDKPDVAINNTQVLNMNYAGIYSLAGTITSENTIVANAGFYAIALLIGGNYTFYHTTVANLWAYSNRTDPSVVIANNLVANGIYYVGDVQATFGNCIIYGNNDDELGLGEDDGYGFNILFQNCMITNKETDISDTTRFKNIFTNLNPEFVDFSENNFELDTLSPVIDKGSINIGNLVPTDYKGDSRTSDIAPDLGAFERVP